jgi:single-strand DNA-binding protein
MLLTIPGTARIVRDIELRYTQSGSAVASTSIVNSRRWKSKDGGELMEEACFIDVVAFGHTAEFLNQHFGKGDVVTFVGSLQQDKWEDHEGNKRSKHTIRLDSVDFALTSRGEGGNTHTPKAPEERGQPAQQYQAPQQTQQATQRSANTQQPAQQQAPDIDVSDDEIPF